VGHAMKGKEVSIIEQSVQIMHSIWEIYETHPCELKGCSNQ